MSEKFERRLLNPFFRACQRFFCLIILNLVFCVMSILSLMVLFFPGLVALHKVANEMVNDEDDHPYRDFFLSFKEQWPFSWRIEVTGMTVLIVAAAIYYFDWVYKEKVSYDIFVWISFIFVSVVLLVLIAIFVHLMIYNNYIKNDTFFMMIKKSAVITSKKILFTLLNTVILACFVIVSYIIPYVIPFISFSFYILIVEAINRHSFQKIAREELERETLAENLFLPIMVKEEKVMKNALVIGSMNMDYSIYCNHFPLPGETMYGNNRFVQPGGKGANQCAAIAKSSLVDVSFLSSRGKDHDGEEIEQLLKELKVNTLFKVNEHVPTGNATIIIDEKGENKIIIIAGANAELKPSDVSEDLLKKNDLVVLQNEIPNETNEYVINKCKELNKVVVYNPAPYREINSEILAKVDYFIVNEVELAQYSKEEDFEKGIAKMMKLGVKNLIVTLGKEGSLLVNDKGRIKVNAHKVNAVDTVAAGDTYVGYFVAALMSGKDLKESMEVASYASALTVTKKGSIVSIPLGKEVFKNEQKSFSPPFSGFMCDMWM